jgi:preprotein translocase subunit SecE
MEDEILVGVAEFIKQVRQEASKVTWGTRKDTLVSTGVVLMMVLVASVFFLIVDSILFKVTQTIMGF